jgi:cardiolipin synthase
VQWFLRDHRKLLIVDDTVGFTGGVGISDVMSGWRDTHVMVTGPIIEQMKLAFERMWFMTSKGKRIFKFLQSPSLDGNMILLTNTPYRRQRFIYHALLDAIKNSEKEICLATPYFIPDRKLFRALKRAVGRGVKVRLLVPISSDQPFVDKAGASYYWLALRAGIRIFRYKPAMMHAKTVVIDDSFSMVGSSNLDNLSLLLNYEDSIIARDKRFVKSVYSQFENDLEDSEEITQESWHSRPLGDKFLELLTWPFHRLL